MSPSPDLVEEFADHVSSTRFEALPADAVEAAKKSILDTMGVILAASGLEPQRSPPYNSPSIPGVDLSRLLGFGSRFPRHRLPSVTAHWPTAWTSTTRHRGGNTARARSSPRFWLWQSAIRDHWREVIAAVAVGQDLLPGFAAMLAGARIGTFRRSSGSTRVPRP